MGKTIAIAVLSAIVGSALTLAVTRSGSAPATSRRTRQQDEQPGGEVNVVCEHPAAAT